MPRVGLAAVNATTGARRHRASPTTSPAASASTAPDRAAAQAHPRRDQAAGGAHRPPDRRPGPLRRRHHQHRRPSSCCPGAPGCGRTTSSSSAASSASTAATSRPTTQYFVVTSGSGGDRPADQRHRGRLPVDRRTTTSQPLWISRALRQRLLGGHHRAGRLHRRPLQFDESPTAPDPWPGLDNVGYGTGQGLSGYGLGDAVVRRDHLGALDPADGKALEWNPGSNSFEGNKAMVATAARPVRRRRRHVPGRRAHRPGRVLRLQHRPGGRRPPTPRSPPRSRAASCQSGVQFTITGHGAPRPAGSPAGPGRDPGPRHQAVPPGRPRPPGARANTSTPRSATPTRPRRAWSLPLTITGNREMQLMAKTFAVNGTSDATKATKKFESFSFDDQTADDRDHRAERQPADQSTTFTVTGTASDDKGVNADQPTGSATTTTSTCRTDGSVSSIFNTFRGTPDVVGATCTTWSVRGHRCRTRATGDAAPRRSTTPASPTSGAPPATGPSTRPGSRRR